MDDLTNQVLGYCNGVRKLLGFAPVKEISKGFRTKADNCPIANTIMAGTAYDVNTYEYCLVFNNKDRQSPSRRLLYNMETPSYIRTWIREFDGGGYEEYASYDNID